MDTEKRLGPNQQGELRVQSDFLMNGYYKMDSSGVYDWEGYLKTGDIVRYDEDECFYMVNRIKEMFKCRGIHIIPSVLEGILLRHPVIKECAVVGIPHEIDGYHPVAVVALQSNGKITTQAIEQFVNKQIYHSNKLIGGIKIVEDLPKNSNGKIIREEIKNMLKTNE